MSLHQAYALAFEFALIDSECIQRIASQCQLSTQAVVDLLDQLAENDHFVYHQGKYWNRATTRPFATNNSI
ncbi:MAG: hypothetical protein FWD76_03570 [Firmicutes bacterium]|nr:hypothetical protein [Bacillota bacterium]